MLRLDFSSGGHEGEGAGGGSLKPELVRRKERKTASAQNLGPGHWTKINSGGGESADDRRLRVASKICDVVHIG